MSVLVLLCWQALLVSAFCAETFAVRGISDADRLSWNATVEQHLQDALWLGRDNYDASHTLMVPLHAAFIWRETAWQAQFADLARRFIQADLSAFEARQLNRVQWSYFMSRFCVVAQKFGRTDLVPAGLPGWLEEELRKQWIDGRIRVNVLWNLNHPNQLPSWTIAIADNQWFCFAIAADMKAWREQQRQPATAEVLEAVQMALRTLREQSRVLEDGGWVYQPGILDDHQEYAYAGHTEKRPGLEPLPMPGVAGDTSHAHRWPLWLQSMAGAFPAGSQERDYIEDLQQRLEHQFHTRVMIPASPAFPAPRAMNFMDGWNGLYRWNYTETNNGYGPFELSGTLALGWWTFLGTERTREAYADLAAAFPLSDSVLDVYLGLPSVRDRHPLVKWPDYFQNDYARLVADLASRLPALDVVPAAATTLRLHVPKTSHELMLSLDLEREHVLEGSTNLTEWLELGRVRGANTVSDAYDWSESAFRFYRLKKL